MRGILYLVLSIMLPGYLFAENAELDSLKVELSLTDSRNKEKLCEIYQSIAVCYETIDIDSTLYYLKKGFSLYEKPDYRDWGYLNLVNTEANYYYSVGNFEKSRDGFHSALVSSSEMPERDYLFEANAAMSLGVVYRKLGIPDSTLYYYNMAADYGKHSGDYGTLSSIYYNIGAMYFGNSRYEEALSNARYALDYADKSGDFIMQIYARILLASSYSRMERYKESTEVLKQNISEALSHDSPLMAMSSLSPLLSTYQLWNKKDSVGPYLKLGSELLDKIPAGHPTALEYIAVQSSQYGWLGEYAKSNKILLGNSNIVAQIGEVKYNLLLAKNYSGLGDYKMAYSYLMDAYEYNDSIYNHKISTEMSEFNAKLNVNAKELEISRLETDKIEQQARNLRLGLHLGGVILVLIIVILVLQYKKRILRKESELVSIRKYIEGLENERKRLAKELHDGVCNDLYGAILQIRRSEVTEESKNEAVHLLESIRNGVRTISHELMPPSFKLANLNEMLAGYFLKIQDQSGVEIIFSSHSDIDWIKVSHDISYEVYRISQEIMSNIIKHCKVYSVIVKLNVGNDRMDIEFRYAGVWNVVGGKPTGIGLRTIEDRLKMIGGTLNVTDDDGITIKVQVDLYNNNLK